MLHRQQVDRYTDKKGNKMATLTKRWIIFRVIYEQHKLTPSRGVTAYQISNRTNIPRSTVTYHLKKLESESLILSEHESTTKNIDYVVRWYPRKGAFWDV